ncbi:MAG: bifunctional diguanylate cyclase/phosphodiesterase [Kineosporiaceae bacterium]
MAHGVRTLESSDSWQGEVTAPHAHDSDGPLHATISALRDARGRVEQYVVWLVDLSERRQAQQQIHQLAYFDALTGLPNRRYLGYRVQQAVAAFGRTKVRSVVLFIDLDGFKDVNDSLGHDLGDLLLCAVAERIGHCVRDVDTVARLGGDEFVVLLPDISPTSAGACAAAEAVAARIAEEVARPLEIEGNRLSTTPSIGIAVVDASTPSADHLLRHADLAMYQAKAAGRNTVRFFDPSMQAQAEARTTLTTALRRAVDDGDLQLYLQPQIDVDRRVVGMEALLRWPHPVRGLVPPSTFIPLAEETGLIAAVGDWVLTQACTTLAQWASVPERSQLTLAVNVSARQLRGVDLAERVCQVLTETGAPPERLELELTESVFLHDVDEAVEVLTRLRDLGVRIALDDFGTGYSCLAYLRRLPLSKLKIDQRFVAGVPTSAPDGEIIRAIIAMVHSLGLPVLAEGVETEEQQAFLAEGGCDYFQGYLHGRPAPLA